LLFERQIFTKLRAGKQQITEGVFKHNWRKYRTEELTSPPHQVSCIVHAEEFQIFVSEISFDF
jgi:hypothetical protein